ncbi:hypothetical protein CMO91_01150 [Candidatus Woesearchaeota archaeon]|nr:hypothetical protein [Candidatus Woesearchaeota archaeon]
MFEIWNNRSGLTKSVVVFCLFYVLCLSAAPSVFEGVIGGGPPTSILKAKLTIFVYVAGGFLTLGKVLVESIKSIKNGAGITNVSVLILTVLCLIAHCFFSLMLSAPFL